MARITPFLWFENQAEEAANYYVSVFSSAPGAADREPSKVLEVSRYPEGAPAPAGSVMVASFMLNGHEFAALNGGPEFKFTEAVSFLVNCDTQEEIDYFWETLTGDGGAPGDCGWLKDKYGLSWQIVPSQLNDLLGGDAESSGRATRALLQMKKLDIEALRRARDAKE